MRAVSGLNIVLGVLGDGPYDAQLKEIAGDHVIFYPATPELDRYIAGADVIFKFASGECVNSVVRESLLVGKLLASTVETAESRLLAEAGLLLEVTAGGDPGELLERLAGFDENESAKISDAASVHWNNQAIRDYYSMLSYE